ILAPYALYDFSIFSDPKKGIYAYIDNSRKYEWHQMCNRIKMINQVFINAFGKQCIVNKIYEHALSFCSAMDSSDKNAKAYLTAFFKSSRSRKISTILGSKLFLTKAILRDNNYPHKNSESQHVIESGLFSLEMAVKNSYLFIAAGHKEAEC
ncbi:MAG: hypothetical protein KKD01_19610, partial [Proteobacteria bacterium]|nr:hypothetical protein [Pseudomonadota bacterium]